jgi:hypothetical protein
MIGQVLICGFGFVICEDTENVIAKQKKYRYCAKKLLTGA